MIVDRRRILLQGQLHRWFLVCKLHLDIYFVWLLVYVVVDGPFNRDVCPYVEERYWLFAELYRDLGKLE